MTEELLQNEEIILDEVNRHIIQATQSGLPLVSRPYHDIAEGLGITASEVISRMKAMQDAGIIRRLAAVPHHYALGYKGNGMSVWDVPGELVKDFGENGGLGRVDVFRLMAGVFRRRDFRLPGRKSDYLPLVIADRNHQPAAKPELAPARIDLTGIEIKQTAFLSWMGLRPIHLDWHRMIRHGPARQRQIPMKLGKNGLNFQIQEVLFGFRVGKGRGLNIYKS